MSKNLTRVLAVLVLAVGAGACSTIDSAYDDVMGTDTAAAPTDANGFPPDTAPDSGGAASGTTPDLAAVPPKPSGVTSPDAQAATTDSLGADRARNNYSADALRAGTEAAAAPPPATPEPAPTVAPSSPPPAATPASDSDSADNTAPPAPAPTQPITSAAAPPPPAPAVTASVAPPVSGDMAPTFRPSAAPPLDPTITKFVSQPIVARYQQTAALARSVNGPHYGSSAMTPTAVVMFPGDGTALNAAGRAQVRAAVDAFKQAGASGYIKVVGHSSTALAQNSPTTVYAKSQARAKAVASEIIREGVPASQVQVEAVGDSQPAAQGDAGNRRAEIFVQN